MSENNPVINLVAYLDSDSVKLSNKKTQFYSAIHGYTYDLTKEGKRKLVKDVPTSSGYYTGNQQKTNTVVNLEDVVTVLNPATSTQISAILGSFKLLLTEFVNNPTKYKNLCVISKHTMLGTLDKLKNKDVDELNELGREKLTKEDKKLLSEVLDLMKQFSKFEEPKLIIYDFSGSVEGGLGNRLNAKEMDTCLVDTKWGSNHSPTISIMSKKEYEDPKTDFNKIVTASRWYFESGSPDDFYKLKDGYRCYDFGRVEPDKKYYGKLTPDVTYSKLYTKEPITHLDKMYDFANKKISNPEHYLLGGDLRTITSKDTCRLLDTLPGFVEKKDLISPITRQGKKPILIEVINPVMLSFRVREALETVDDLYDIFKKRNQDNVFGHTKFYDITEELYLIEEDKKGVKKIKLRPEITQNVQVHYTDVEHRSSNKPVRLMLSIGYDLPERNSLTSITDPNAKVWLAADTTNDIGVRYATIVETDEFIYVHSSPGANLRVLALKELKK